MTSAIHHVLLDSVPEQARAFVKVSGADASRFLQGLLTADVHALKPGHASPAALLTVKGKLVSELWLLGVGEDELWLALPAAIAPEVLRSLDDHIIMDEVELEPLEGCAGALLWVVGEGRVEREGLAGELGDPALAAFVASHPAPGLLLVGPRASLIAQLAAGGSTAADAVAYTAHRIAHRRPAWGFELAPERFPPELGFVDAVAYDKGCYLGQEPLSRIHNRGQVNHVMVAVSAASCPAGDAPLELSLDGQAVGRWTSRVATAEGGAAGLAIVRRRCAEPGTRLQAGELELLVETGALGDAPAGAQGGGGATVKLGGRR